MKLNRILPTLSIAAIVALSTACNEDVSEIGNTLQGAESVIRIDSVTYDLHGVTVVNENYDARSGNLLLGNINVPEYGILKCSFVTRMLSATACPVPDTIPESQIDDCVFSIGVVKDNLTGDTLAPQKLAVYQLTKQLPSGIDNSFDPAGYYNPKAALGTLNYTYSSVSNTIRGGSNGGTPYYMLEVPVGKDYALNILREYRNNPDLFQWPQTFAQFFPGIYVENTFGNGAVGNIYVAGCSVKFHRIGTSEKKDEETGITTVEKYEIPDSALVYLTAPEVLSSNRIKYEPSEKIKDAVAQGKHIITTPGGYYTKFTFPAQAIISEYNKQASNINIISSLTMTVPAKPIENDFGISAAPYMLMIKTSEINDFFAKNKIPDNKTSFYSAYDSTNESYSFPSLRSYILDLINKGRVDADDVDFTFLPVMMTIETEEDYYGSSKSYVVGCVPYTVAPTMTEVDTEKAEIVFTFSSTLME